MKKQIKGIILRWIAVLAAASVLFTALFLRIKPLIFTYAKSYAETICLNSANQAVLNVLNAGNISYDSISRVSKGANGDILGIEIDISAVNSLKSGISNEIMRIIAQKSFYDIEIPIGSLLGFEYTVGMGPRITLHMQMTETAVLDFESNFSDAGINQTLHQIIIKIDISANILMLGCTQGFSVSTTAIAAQTVIVGATPDTFTNVEEYPGDDIADELFNYAELQ